MFLVIIFLVLKINANQQEYKEGIEFDLKTLQELAMLEFQNDQLDDQSSARNIAVNEVEDRVENFDDYNKPAMSQQSVNNIVTDLIRQDINEIISDNNLNPDDRELPDIATQTINIYKPEKFKEEQVYKGPTNIYYNLEGRSISYLKIPVYKCEGAGLIHLDIRVNRRGKVEWVTVDTATSSTSDPCLIKAARQAALMTKFNFSTKAPMLQSGTITYRFIAQ